MRENREFFIWDDGIRLHLKLDFPQENCGDRIGKGCGAFSPEPEEPGKLPLMILVHGFTGDMEERHITAVQRTANEEGFASGISRPFSARPTRRALPSCGRRCTATAGPAVSSAITPL